MVLQQKKEMIKVDHVINHRYTEIVEGRDDDATYNVECKEDERTGNDDDQLLDSLLDTSEKISSQVKPTTYHGAKSFGILVSLILFAGLGFIGHHLLVHFKHGGDVAAPFLPLDICDSSEKTPQSPIHCPDKEVINEGYSIVGDRCFQETSEVAAAGDFVIPNLQPGQVTPIIWRETSKVVTQHGYHVGLPSQLTTSLLEFGKDMGIIELFKQFTSEHPLPNHEKHNGQFIKLATAKGNKAEYSWYAQGLEAKWRSNIHWISPGNERTHEKFLRVLGSGSFDTVLDGIGRALDLDSLVVYQISFFAASHGAVGSRHYDSINTGGKAMGIIIPLLLEDDATPELTLWDDRTNEKGVLKYKYEHGVIMGDKASHSTAESDYRNLKDPKHGGYLNDKKIGMRLCAIVYVSQIEEDNVKGVVEGSVSQIFPLWDTYTENWLLSQQGRHWHNEYLNNTMANDMGRKYFEIIDQLSDCNDRVKTGLCESDVKETRKKCLASCQVYIGNHETGTQIEH